MREELTKIINDLDGFVMFIGEYEDVFLEKIQKNTKITEVEIWSNNSKLSPELKNFKEKTEIIRFEKLRKNYKKKGVNYIVCDYENIKEYSKYLARETIGVAKKEVYLILDKDEDINIIKKRFHRYDTVVQEINTADKIFLKVDTSKAKNRKIKDFFYYVSDTFYNGFDFIGEILSR